MAERDNPVYITNEQAGDLIDRMYEDRFKGKAPDSTLEAFSNMLDQGFALTEKQLRWVQNIAEKLELVTAPAGNSWSSLSPAQQARIRGKDVPTPPALQQRVLRPPHRLGELKKKT